MTELTRVPVELTLGKSPALQNSKGALFDGVLNLILLNPKLTISEAIDHGFSRVSLRLRQLGLKISLNYKILSSPKLPHNFMHRP